MKAIDILLMFLAVLTAAALFSVGFGAGSSGSPLTGSVEKRQCKDGELRLLVRQPDSSTKWVRGRTPIWCGRKP
jgi:hypothetical protein